MLAYDTEQKELHDICTITKNQAALLTDDVWSIIAVLLRSEYMRFIKRDRRLDVICFDITEEDGIERLEQLRKKQGEAYLILLADAAISPVRYMKPSIMASSLLLRPMNDESIIYGIREMIQTLNSADKSEVFVVEDEDGRTRIPYGDIFYFEAKEKKVYACTKSAEYGFYGTMEKLAETLPDNFKRCHRGYIVNVSYIQKIALTEGLVYLKDDFIVPVSRSYKNVMKEYKHGKE
jgi:DNA-binding LytR/AlgR family response regulator